MLFMLYLITYDVSTANPAGRARLRRVAKECENYGIRVQNSVFECHLSYDEYQRLKHRLCLLIDPASDSLRFYPLGKSGISKVQHVGAKVTLDVTAPIII